MVITVASAAGADAADVGAGVDADGAGEDEALPAGLLVVGALWEEGAEPVGGVD
ncbi:MAG: hypothetical protein ABI181_09140 [Mycobacteriaceae bacterium]